MGLFNMTSGMRLGTGLAIGAVAVILGPVIVPVAAGVVKSLAKAGIKGGMILYEKGKVLAEETREAVEDLTAEAKSELAEGKEVAVVTPTKAASAKAAPAK